MKFSFQQWKQNLNHLNHKKIVVFASGASLAKQDVVDEVRNKNFTVEEQTQIQFFYLRGGFDYNKLGRIDKVLMTIMKMMLKNKKEKNSDDKGMLAAYEKPADFTNKKYINEIVAYVSLPSAF